MQVLSTIFVTGAGGYIGGSVASKLIQGGYRVRGLVRTEQKASALAKLGIEPVIGDLSDTDLILNEAQQADGVVNTASADHAESVQALIDGLANSTKPLIHTSGSSIVGDDVRGSQCSDLIFDEYTPLIVQPLKQARRDIDLLVLNAAGRGVRSVVICPSLIYGVGKGLNLQSVQLPFLAENARQTGAVQIVGAGLNVWSNVHIDDVVDLFDPDLHRVHDVRAAAGAVALLAVGDEDGFDVILPVGRSLHAEGGFDLDAFAVVVGHGDAQGAAAFGQGGG